MIYGSEKRNRLGTSELASACYKIARVRKTSGFIETSLRSEDEYDFLDYLGVRVFDYHLSHQFFP